MHREIIYVTLTNAHVQVLRGIRMEYAVGYKAIFFYLLRFTIYLKTLFGISFKNPLKYDLLYIFSKLIISKHIWLHVCMLIIIAMWL
jgi:hypothetical protein